MADAPSNDGVEPDAKVAWTDSGAPTSSQSDNGHSSVTTLSVGGSRTSYTTGSRQLRRHSRSSGGVESVIRKEVLRGVPLSTALRRFGGLWRTSPVDLPEERKTGLYKFSQQVSELDVFISQTWLTPGWQKYLTLLLHYYWKPAGAVTGVTGLVLIFLDVSGFLPTVEVPPGTLMENDSVEICPWSTIPPLVGLCAALAMPSLPCIRCPMVFLDITCIHQTDEQLKQEGVYSLGGFLFHSKELVVLWTPDYLKRTWCVYELALFSAWNDSGKIVWCRIFEYKFLFFWYCFYIVVMLAKNMTTLQVGPVMALIPLSAIVLAYSLARLYPDFVRQISELQKQTEVFDVKNAEARVDSDKAFLMSSVEHWHGSHETFNAYVRKLLKNMMTLSTFDVGVDHGRLFLVISPFIFSGLQNIAGLSRKGFPPLTLVWLVTYHLTDSTLLIMFISKLLLRILEAQARWVPTPSQFQRVILAAMFSVFVIIFIFLFVIFVGYPIQWNSDKPEYSLSYAAGVFLLNVWAFRTSPRKRPSSNRAAVVPAEVDGST